jgi:hypothetical protein
MPARISGSSSTIKSRNFFREESVFGEFANRSGMAMRTSVPRSGNDRIGTWCRSGFMANGIGQAANSIYRAGQLFDRLKVVVC